MKTTLVINPKGGAGKTTLAINLASYFATSGISTTVMDYDPQGSSLNWLRARPADAVKIHAANAAPEKFGRMRSFEMYVPRETRHLIIDPPAGTSGVLLHELLDRSSSILIPIVPSVIDLHATGNFLREILSMGRMKTGNIRMAVVANKVRRSMPAYGPLQQLLDSDVYLRAAETGAGIFEMNAVASVECRQFMPIAEWVAQEPGLAEAFQARAAA